MNTRYKTVLIVSAVLSLNNAFAAEEAGYRTFYDTQLELILQVEEGEITFNNLDILTEEERADFKNSFRVIPLRNAGYLASGFYLLNGAGEIRKYKYTEEPKAFVHPSKDGDCYLVCKGAYINFNYDDYSPVIKELYDMEDRLIWSHDIKGHVKAADDLGTLIVKNIIRGPGIAIINNGIYNRFFPRSAGNAFCISTDGGIIVIPEKDGGVPTTGPKGTRVYDNRGELLFTLNPDFAADIGTGTRKPLEIYASGKYIIQICQKAIRKPFYSPVISDEGDELENLTGVPGAQYIQVYNRNGELLWQEVFGVSHFIISFTLAENEEYLAVILPTPTPECRVFEVQTGEEQYRIYLPEGFRHVSNAGISNDGSTLFVVKNKWSDSGSIVEGKVILFIGGRKAVTFGHTYDYNETDGSFDLIFSKASGLFVITADRGFRLFRMSPE